MAARKRATKAVRRRSIERKGRSVRRKVARRRGASRPCARRSVPCARRSVPCARWRDRPARRLERSSARRVRRFERQRKACGRRPGWSRRLQTSSSARRLRGSRKRRLQSTSPWLRRGRLWRHLLHRRPEAPHTIRLTPGPVRLDRSSGKILPRTPR